MKICPNCNRSNDDSTMFCSSCGTKLGSLRIFNSASTMSFCTTCGTKLTEGSAFCENCGTRVAGAEESEFEYEDNSGSIQNIFETPVNNPAPGNQKQMVLDFTEVAANLNKAALNAEITIQNFDWENETVINEISEKMAELDNSGLKYELVFKIDEGLECWSFTNSLFDDHSCVSKYYIPVSVYKFQGWAEECSEKCYMPDFWKSKLETEANFYPAKIKQFRAGRYTFSLSTDDGVRYAYATKEDFNEQHDISEIEDGFDFACRISSTDTSEIFDGAYVAGGRIELYIEKEEDDDPRFPMTIYLEGDSGIYSMTYSTDDGYNLYLDNASIEKYTWPFSKETHYEGMYGWDSHGSETFNIKEDFNITDITPCYTEFGNCKLDENICGAYGIFTCIRVFDDSEVFVGSDGEPNYGMGYVVEVDEDGNTDWLYD